MGVKLAWAVALATGAACSSGGGSSGRGAGGAGGGAGRAGGGQGLAGGGAGHAPTGGGPTGGAPSGGTSGSSGPGATGGTGSGLKGGGAGGSAAGGAGGAGPKPAAPQPVSFKAVVDHWLQPLGGARVAADLDGDGHADIAVVDWRSDVAVRLGQGDGSFREPGDEPIPEPWMDDPTAAAPEGRLVAADLNGDGRVDIVAANTAGHGVTVRLGNGDGSFAPGALYAVGSNPFQLLATDLTGDGSLDLVVVRQDPTDPTLSRSELVLLANQGKGTFAPFVPLNVGAKISVQSAASADLDGDGLADLVLGGCDSTRPPGLGVVIAWINRANLKFANPREYTVNRACYPPLLALGDIDGDHLLDVVAADPDNVTILHGAAAGALKVGAASPLTDWDALSPLWLEPVLLDLDADGHLDLVMSGGLAEGLSIQLGDGQGRFGPIRISSVGWTSSARDVAFADFDEDGLVDVEAADGVFKNAGAGALLPATSPSFADASIPYDLDGDSRVDVVTAFSDPLSISVRESHGTFEPATVLPEGITSILAAGDLNGDGRTDLLVDSRTAERARALAVLLNQGSGQFAPPVHYPLGPSFNPRNGFGLSLTRIRDLDGDGKPDVVALNAANATVSVLLNRGEGVLEPAADYPVELAHVRDYTSGDLAIADFDGDGAPDLVVTYQPVGGVALLRNAGGGRFDPPRQVFAQPVDSLSRSLWLQPLGAADLDGDGRPEIVIAGDRDVGTDQRAGRLTVLRNLAGGTFGRPEDYEIGPHASSIVFADLNDDGRTDIIATTSVRAAATDDHGVGTSLSILFGYGDGTFLPSADYPLNGVQEAGRPAVLDYRGDSRPEIVVISDAAFIVLFRDP